jgi:putative FmdB family regulatory protein
VPIYEFRCKRCQKDFEKYVAGVTTAVACSTCQSPEVMRKLSVFGLKTAPGVASSAVPAGGGGCCGGGCSCH